MKFNSRLSDYQINYQKYLGNQQGQNKIEKGCNQNDQASKLEFKQKIGRKFIKAHNPETKNTNSLIQFFNQCFNQSSQCHVHNEPFSIFCEKDQELICVECKSKKGKHGDNHQIKFLKEELAFIQQDLINFYLEDQNKLQTQSKQMLELLEKNNLAYINDFQNIRKQVKQLFREIHDIFDVCENQFIQQIENKFNKEMFLNRSKIEEIKSFIDLQAKFNDDLKGHPIYTQSISQTEIANLNEEICKHFNKVNILKNIQSFFTHTNYINKYQSNQIINLNSFQKICNDQILKQKFFDSLKRKLEYSLQGEDPIGISKIEKEDIQREIDFHLEDFKQFLIQTKCQYDQSENHRQRHILKNKEDLIKQEIENFQGPNLFISICRRGIIKKEKNQILRNNGVIQLRRNNNIKIKCRSKSSSIINSCLESRQDSIQNQNILSIETTSNKQILQQSKPLFLESLIIGKNYSQNPKLYEIFHFDKNIQQAKLLFRLSKHGLETPQIFHDKIKGQYPIICFIQANGAFIFGFYSGVPINYNQQRNIYIATDQVYIFSLTTPSNGLQPQIFLGKPDKKHIAINIGFQGICFGKKLSNSADLMIDLENLKNSYSNIGYAYNSQNEQQQGINILAGRYTHWNIMEIEVYSLII